MREMNGHVIAYASPIPYPIHLIYRMGLPSIFLPTKDRMITFSFQIICVVRYQQW